MQAREFLNVLSKRGIQLEADKDQLRFKAPAGAMTAKLRMQIARRKEELLRILGGYLIKDLAEVAIEPAARDRSLPLSYGQERLWVLDQMEPGNVAYNMPGALRIRGELKVGVLERCLGEIVRRHEILRTTFEVRSGVPVQVVHPAKGLVLEEVDLQAEQDVEQRVRELIAAEGHHRFDLSTGPLMRVRLLKLKEDEHVLLLTLHHIIFDGWSGGILVKEFVELYKAFAAGKESPLAELPIQYSDYAVWQKKWLSGQVMERQLNYWNGQLKKLNLLELPVDRPRVAAQSYRGSNHRLKIEGELLKYLEALAQSEGATLFMLLSATFKVLLFRYTGLEDIAIGTPIANRTNKETETLIGFFVNILVLRTDLSGDPTFLELLGQERKITLEAYDHQDLPFEKVVEQLQPARDLSRTPLFQVMIVLQNTPRETLKISGLEFAWMPHERKTVQFDVVLSLQKGSGGLEGALEFNHDLFDVPRIERFGKHWINLLEQIVNNPGQHLSKFEILDPMERRQILIDWNNTAHDYVGCKCIHEMFEDQVECSPNAIAIVCGGQRLSYRELNWRANNLARALAVEGVVKGAKVPFLMEQGVGVPISMFGIMKAGGAFVPLDVNWPLERIRLILEDLKSSVIVTDKSSKSKAGSLCKRVLVLDAFTNMNDPENPRVTIDLEDPIYIIYTSGSTGRPKGVVIPHRGITNRFLWMNEFFGREVAGSVLQTTRHVFDSAVWQLMWPLILGGKTVIPPAHVLMTAETIAGLIGKEAVTMTDFVPSILNAMIPAFTSSEKIEGSLDTLHCLIVGGEEIIASCIKEFQTHFPAVRVVNLYGPTEASIGCIAYEIPHLETNDIPIGKPIANVHALILDKQRRCVPVGVVGELYLAGKSVGLGYLNDQKKTDEVFVPNPFPEIPYPVLYKTGDLARYRPDGNIDFRGRKDHQIKIRGQRIELGEIESALNELPHVRQSAVVAIDRNTSEKMLVGYLVLDEARTKIGDVRRYLHKKLPAYMIPTQLIALDRFPLTAGGKVNRKMLPDPNLQEKSDEFIAPRTPTEVLLVEIYKNILKLDRIGVTDNFFELGGHSLLAIQLISRISYSFKVKISLKEIFTRPSVELLADLVVKKQTDKSNGLFSTFSLLGHEEQVKPSLSQQRLLMVERLNPKDCRHNLTQTVRLKGLFNVEAMNVAIKHLVTRHDALRMSFSDSEFPTIVINGVSAVTIQSSDYSKFDDARQREQMAIDVLEKQALTPFDLIRGPLIRFSLIRLTDDEHILSYTVHHLVYDGWSEGILAKELKLIYEAILQKREIDLPNINFGFKDFIRWENNSLKTGKFSGQINYWLNQLSNPPTLKFPLEFPEQISKPFKAARFSFAFDKEISECLRRFFQKYKVTEFVGFLAALFTLVSRYSNQSDILIGSPLARRTCKEFENFIGYISDTHLFRVRLSDDETFWQLIRQIQKMALDVQENQNVPFPAIMQALQQTQEYVPIYDIRFAYQNFPMPPLKLNQLKISPINIQKRGYGGSTRHISLYMKETSSQFSGYILYNARLFSQKYIEKMVKDFKCIVFEILDNPNAMLQ